MKRFLAPSAGRLSLNNITSTTRNHVVSNPRYWSSSFSSLLSQFQYDRNIANAIHWSSSRRFYVSSTNDEAQQQSSSTTITTAHTTNHHQQQQIYRQHSLQDGTLRHKLRNGYPTVGVVTGFYNDTDHVETLGLLGYDFLWADAEHSSAGPSSVAKLVLAAERRGMPTLVRIGYGYQNIIGHSQKFLVAGAQGIILPQCESKADVEKIVEAVKFPPLGRRGLAGERWNAWGLGPEYGTLADRVREANKNSVVGVVVESKKGIDALDEILEVPELDFVFVAPTDLSSDMGLHGQIRHPQVIEKINEAGLKIRGAGVASGMLALKQADYTFWRNKGFQVLCMVAHNMFVDGAKRLMDDVVEYELGGVDKLKKAALRLMTSDLLLNEEELRTLRNFFEEIDTSGEGKISFEEIDRALESGIFASNTSLVEKLQLILEDLAHYVGNDNALDWEDFVANTADDKKLLENENNLRLAFETWKQMDVSTATISDLTQIFGGEAVAKQAMEEVDDDSDSNMSFLEFRNAILFNKKESDNNESQR